MSYEQKKGLALYPSSPKIAFNPNLLDNYIDSVWCSYIILISDNKDLIIISVQMRETILEIELGDGWGGVHTYV